MEQRRNAIVSKLVNREGRGGPLSFDTAVVWRLFRRCPKGTLRTDLKALDQAS